MKEIRKLEGPWRVTKQGEPDKTYVTDEALSVHEVLMAEGVLSERILLGECELGVFVPAD